MSSQCLAKSWATLFRRGPRHSGPVTVYGWPEPHGQRQAARGRATKPAGHKARAAQPGPQSQSHKARATQPEPHGQSHTTRATHPGPQSQSHPARATQPEPHSQSHTTSPRRVRRQSRRPRWTSRAGMYTGGGMQIIPNAITTKKRP